MNWGAYAISFTPHLPWPVIGALAAVLLLLSSFTFLKNGRGALLRFLAGGILILALLDPILLIEERRGEKDVAVVLIDRSPSNKIPQREEKTNLALQNLKSQLRQFNDIELQEREFGNDRDIAENGTQIKPAWNQALKNIPPGRLAGVVVIGDGQMTDRPEDITPQAPTHLLLTDNPAAKDRRLRILSAPGFGLINKEITMRVMAEDLGGTQDGEIPLTLFVNGKELKPERLVVGEERGISITIERGDQNIVELSLPSAGEEITLANNKAILSIQGVRDRLKVLLVSGEPYPGERMWRNMLKSDPAVDLIHFTILRPPDKQDATPISELALIAFPVDELFYEKLKDFDLIIFDRFQHVGILPDDYFNGIIEYVRNGGSLFEAEGPSSAGQFGLSRTELGLILTGKPSGEVIDQGFKPSVTALGRKHPVTSALIVHPDEAAAQNDKEASENWGRWFRLIAADPGDGQIVLSGPHNLPLLLLNRIEKGRVAQLFSDHLWLWQRGFEGGGPYTELIRRSMHWLMREPKLEEERLSGSISDNRLSVVRRSLLQLPAALSVTLPNGDKREIAMKEASPGEAHGVLEISEEGLYKIEDRDKIAFAANGRLNSKEWEDPRASTSQLQKSLEKNNGGSFIIDANGGIPKLRRTDLDGAQSGSNWMGLRRNQQYTVTGHRQAELLPGWAALFLALSAALLAWWREGR